MSFKRGDIVEITDTGKIYSAYRDAVTEHILDPYFLNMWEYNRNYWYDDGIMHPNCKFLIIAIWYDDEVHRELVYIKHENENECYLIDADGLLFISHGTISVELEPDYVIEEDFINIVFE